LPPVTRISLLALFVAALSYLLLPVLVGLLPPQALLVLNLLPEVLPALLVICVLHVFEERQPGWFGWCALSLSLLLASFLYFGIVAQLELELRWVNQAWKALLALTAIGLLWQGRQNDLSDARSRIRLMLIGALALAAVLIIGTELVFRWQVPQMLEFLGMALIFLVAVAGNLAFLRVNPSLELSETPPFEQLALAQGADPRIEKLLTRVKQQRLYADHDLRIAGLATQTEMSEHKLRELINQKLGYRNFNQFINEFRIQEARERLLSEPHLPILSIALDVGFRSLSSFNSSFKATMSCTPSEWRLRHKAALDSD